MAELTPALRQRLALLLSIDDLESPQQLYTFDDNVQKTISSFEMLQRSLRGTRDRKARYREFDRMDENSDISSSLDAYAEEVTVLNREKDRTIWAVSDSQEIVEIIHALFDKLRIENEIFGYARCVAKYGDDFERLYYDERGVYHWHFLEPAKVDRITDEFHRLRGYELEMEVGLNTTGVKQKANTVDVLHTKIYGASRDGWGESFLHGIHRTFQVLDQLETALALYRLHRAADRNVFYVDVGQATPDQAFAIVNRWKQMYRKGRWFNSGKGEVDFKHNPIDIIEDYFWPVQKGSESKIDRLAGSSNVGDIADIEMFRNKLRYALGIPKGYWGEDDGGVFDAKAGLVQQDMKFAKKVERLQRAIIQGMTRLVQIHLILIGRESAVGSFQLRMEPLSYLSEMQRMEGLQQRVIVLQGLVEVGQMLGFDPEAWAEYLMKKVLFTSDEEFNDFMAMQAEAVAAKQKLAGEADDAEKEAIKSGEAFSNAKAGASQRAKRPGGQSGGKSAKSKATTKAKATSDSAPIVKANLVEEDLIEQISSMMEDPHLKNKLKEVRESIESLDLGTIL